MDHNEFFRLTTLCICSTLEIEKAMSDCIGAIRDVPEEICRRLPSAPYGLCTEKSCEINEGSMG